MKILAEKNPKKDAKPPLANLVEENRKPTDTFYLLVTMAMSSMWVYAVFTIYPFRAEYEFFHNEYQSLVEKSKNISLKNGTSDLNEVSSTATKYPNRTLEEAVSVTLEESSLGAIMQVIILVSILLVTIKVKMDCLFIIICTKFNDIVFCVISILLIGVVFYRHYDKLANIDWIYYKDPCNSIPLIYRAILLILIAIMLADLLSQGVIDEISKKEGTILEKFRMYFNLSSLCMNLIVFTPILMTYVVMYMSAKLLYLTYSDKMSFYAILMASIYIVNYIYYVVKMSSHQYNVITLHTEEKDSRNKLKILLQSIRTVSRYHLGTVSFASTMILPMGVALCQVCKYRFRETQTFWNRVADVILLPYLIFRLPAYSLIVTGIQGKGYHEASKKIFSTIMKNSVSCLGSYMDFCLFLPVCCFVIWCVEGAIKIAWLEYCPNPDIKNFTMSDHLKEGKIMVVFNFYISWPLILYHRYFCERVWSCEMIGCNEDHKKKEVNDLSDSNEKKLSAPMAVGV